MAKPAVAAPAPRTMADFHMAASRTDEISALTAMFADMIAAMGITSHGCLAIVDDEAELRFGDAQALPHALHARLADTPLYAPRQEAGLVIIPVESWHEEDLYLCLFGRSEALGAADLARLHGWCEVYATYASALVERAADVPTASGLGLVQRQCLAQFLFGRSDIEIGDCLHLSPLAVRGHMEDAVSQLGAANRAEAVSLAARRGWLAGLPVEGPRAIAQ